MIHPSAEFDLAIIGGGLVGNMLAAAMARNGVNVVILEEGVYPKFAIGESMILETSEIMRSLALVFDVPELEYFSAENFLPIIGSTHGVKRHFSYAPHRHGEALKAKDIIQAIIPKTPYSHELHLYRQDSDYFYAGIAVKYGATLLQNVSVKNVEFGADNVQIDAQDGRSLTAQYVVDAGGYRSVIATQKNLRHNDLLTHTRGIFTHMTGVRSMHQNGMSKRDLTIPFSLSEGTLHHVFEGGWIWVIPFDNHPAATNDYCSVGLLLDPRVHGPAPDISREDEFNRFIKRFPDLDAHLSGAKPVRNWVRSSDRLQYASKKIVGDRFCLMGHAGGFIDPLFSKGLYTSLASALTFGRLFLKAHRPDRDYSRSAFLELEKQTFRYGQTNDQLVSNAIKCFSHADLWRQYSVIWILGAYLELVRLTTYRQSLIKNCNTLDDRLSYPMPELSLVGGGYDDFEKLASDIDRVVEAIDTKDPDRTQRAVEEIYERLMSETWIPHSHRQIANGARHLPTRKFTWRLFMAEGGILGSQKFRHHFTRTPAF